MADMRLINASDILWRLGWDDDRRLLMYARDTDIDAMPTIDAVPVVRCKDCVFLSKRLIVKNRGAHCLTWNQIVNPDNGYCNYGRRSDDVGNG